MEAEVANWCHRVEKKGKKTERDSVFVKRRTLQAVLEECQRALEELNDTAGDRTGGCEEDKDRVENGGGRPREDRNREESASERGDNEADELYDLIKSRVGCRDFLEKLECAHVALPPDSAEDISSWDMVSDNDLWDGESISTEDDYVLVRQEDIVEGIACFMAAYLSSTKQTKELTPNQLQEALCKTFSVKNRKGKLRKAWEGSKVIYNIASWGATAIGIYQNPMIFRVASKAFWASCQVISKLV